MSLFCSKPSDFPVCLELNPAFEQGHQGPPRPKPSLPLPAPQCPAPMPSPQLCATQTVGTFPGPPSTRPPVVCTPLSTTGRPPSQRPPGGPLACDLISHWTQRLSVTFPAGSLSFFPPERRRRERQHVAWLVHSCNRRNLRAFWSTALHVASVPLNPCCVTENTEPRVRP